MPRVNFPILLMAIVLSTSLWFIRFGQDLITDQTLAIVLPKSNVIGLPPRLSIKNISSLNLGLEGPAAAVTAAVTNPNITDLITVDLTAAKAGHNRYPVHFRSPLNSIVKTNPSYLAVDLEDIVTKSVPVKVELRGKLSDPNSELVSYAPTDSSVIISAPKSVADKITAARAVLFVNQIDTTEPKVQKNAPLVVVDENGQNYDATIDPATVDINPLVLPAHIFKSVVISPVITGTPATGYLPLGAKLTPNKIQLTGPTSMLVNVNSVKTQPIDVSDLKTTKWFVVKLVFPRGTTSTLQVVHVRYEIGRDPAYKRATASNSTPAPVSTPKTGIAP